MRPEGPSRAEAMSGRSGHPPPTGRHDCRGQSKEKQVSHLVSHLVIAVGCVPLPKWVLGRVLKWVLGGILAAGVGGGGSDAEEVGSEGGQ